MKKLALPFLLLVFASTGLMKPQLVSAAAPNHHLSAKSGPNAGEVTLTWRHMDVANNYHLVYGTRHDKYQYGATNIGWVTKYTVKGLTPGGTYHFALVPVNNDVALYTGEQVMAQAASGQVVSPKMPTASVTKAVSQPVTVKGGGNKHWLTARPGPKVGEVSLSWRHIDNANNYHLVYGTEPGKYQYGALNIGWITGLTVRGLKPGTVYYFALVPVKDNVALYTSWYMSARAYGGVEVIETSKEALRQPKANQPVVKAPVKMPVRQKAPDLSVSQAPQATGANEPTAPAGQ